MQATISEDVSGAGTARYARCIEASRRIRWDIERDVIRGRRFDFGKKFMPDGLSRLAALTFLTPAEQRFASQIQGRTYANMSALAERFVSAKAAELSRDHALGDQVAFEALVRLTDEELKHQALFRRLDAMAGEQMPPGYVFRPRPNQVAAAVLGRSTWAVLALTLDIEIYSLAHYRSSIEPDDELSDLWKDVFLFHWKEESQHAIIDELEWRRIDAGLDAAERERAVGELIELVRAVDGTVQLQAGADAEYFLANAGRSFEVGQQQAISAAMLAAYRWQYIVSGFQEPRFRNVLADLVTPSQLERIDAALAPLQAHSAH